jgi:hypothetical protein
MSRGLLARRGFDVQISGGGGRIRCSFETAQLKTLGSSQEAQCTYHSGRNHRGEGNALIFPAADATRVPERPL